MCRAQVGPGRKGHRRGGQIKDLKQAQMLHERGYIVLPDPTDQNVIEAFQMGGSRNSRGILGWEW
jgi:hypothetical protein